MALASRFIARSVTAHEKEQTQRTQDFGERIILLLLLIQQWIVLLLSIRRLCIGWNLLH
ncbi:MAG TPA: hypothetical protein VNG51_20150 [Ktedonobacteraceae bacterium]|nr:hypothetical protein [Ktedonobacteraceae bacterium]